MSLCLNVTESVRRSFRMIGLLLAVIGGEAAGAADTSKADATTLTGEAAVSRLERLVGKSPFLQADFRQTVRDPDGSVLQTVRGQFVAARPRQLHWEVSEPSPQLLVTDGETVWLHDADLAQVTISAFDERDVEAPMLVLGGRTGELLSRYSIVSDGTAADARFVLTPLAEVPVTATFVRLEVLFADGNIDSMTVLDALDQRTEFAFSAVSRPDSVDAKTFVFVVPDGVEVVRR